MRYLKKYFERETTSNVYKFDASRFMNAEAAKQIAIKLGKQDDEGMYSLQKTLDRLLEKKVLTQDVNSFIVQYVNKNDSEFYKRISEKISKIDEMGLKSLVNDIDNLLKNGIHKAHIVTYTNEYVWESKFAEGRNRSSAAISSYSKPDFGRLNQSLSTAKKQLKDLSDKEFLELIDYQSSIG